MRIATRGIELRPTDLLSESVRHDYVYSYPPRQSYTPLDGDVGSEVQASLAESNDLNYYLHFPFCRQICSFCNLYSVADSGMAAHEAYCDVLLEELASMPLPGRVERVPTIYLGGGTPSLLHPELVARVLDAVTRHAGVPLGSVGEVALEVDPSTVDARRIAELASVGINRINLGYQTTDPGELLQIGRRQGRLHPLDLCTAALDAGMDNVCIDLIYGLPGQTREAWTTSVRDVVAARPPTICAYPLTLRPFTGFDRRDVSPTPPAETYARYDVAAAVLSEAGYRQESNVRWTLLDHGYLQKSLHWKSENILGFGAGARSYLRRLDTRNGYSVRPRRSTLESYANSIRAGRSPVTDGFRLSADERMRKAMVLGLGLVSAPAFADEFGCAMTDVFGAELGLLSDAGLITDDDAGVRYTAKGLRHRDAAVQLFFSDDVRRRILAFDYDE